MPRKSKGYSKAAIQKSGKWYGRLRLRKPDGSLKEYTRQARNKTHARQLADELAAKYASGGMETLDAEEMTVADLAMAYKATKIVDPIYDGEIKVAGMIAKGSAAQEVDALVEYWGAVLIQKITHAAIEAYKIQTLQKPTVWRWKEGEEIKEKPRGTPRKMSSVNHLLRRFRVMLNFALRKGWITANPFSQGDPLISEAAEIPRNRAERAGELQDLLDACKGKFAYLRPVILIMTDSALRLTEAKRLTRGEIDFENRVARIRARNTKTNRPRIVPLSNRLLAELWRWSAKVETDDQLILQQGDYKKAWKSIKKLAGITDDLQLRDLRGWGTTRIARALAGANLPPEWGQKTTGHTQIKTYLRYIKTDEDVAQQTGKALENLEDKVA